jgi:hypothetical protein
MTTTIVLWAPTALTEEQSQLINNKAEEMRLEGKTDGVKVVATVGDEIQVTRTWTTLADAQEWEVFVEQYTPDSVTIQS